QRGVVIRTGETVKGMTPDGRVITAAETHQCAAVVCAVPWHAIGRLFAEWDESERSSLPHLSEYHSIPSSPITG
ncbi:MAG: hypothetical protein AAFN70_20925, partial [Planctomycetota bacterium]